MPIIVTCECGKQFQTSDANAGGRSQCPACGRDLIIPKAEFDPGATASPILEELTPRTSGKAIASLVLGILSLFCSFFTGLPATADTPPQNVFQQAPVPEDAAEIAKQKANIVAAGYGHTES